MKKSKTPKAVQHPLPVVISMPPRDYQPSKAEKEAEVKMSGASLKAVREAFFRPVKVKVKAVKKGTKPKK